MTENNTIKLFVSEKPKPNGEDYMTTRKVCFDEVEDYFQKDVYESDLSKWKSELIELKFATPEDEYDIIAHEDLMGKNDCIDVTDITDIKYSNYLDAEKTKPNHLVYYKEVKDLNTTEYYQPLFDLMSEHNIHLLEGEMDEIISTVIEMENKRNINNRTTACR